MRLAVVSAFLLRSDDPLRWAAELGADTHKVELAWFGGIRGLAAREPVKAGEAVASLPLALTLSSLGPPPDGWRGGARCDRLWAAAPAALGAERPTPGQERFLPHVRLTLRLLHERRLGPRSKLQGYLALLPADFAWHPMAAGPGLLAAFEGLPLAKAAADFQATYQQVHSWLAEDECLGFAPSVEEVMWAALNVQSRSYGHKCQTEGGVEPCTLLVPVSDLANTRPGLPDRTNTRWGGQWASLDMPLQPGGRWVLTAKRGLAAGDEVTEWYGDKTNAEYAQIWGFVQPGNPRPSPALPAAACGSLVAAARARGGARCTAEAVACTLAAVALEQCP